MRTNNLELAMSLASITGKPLEDFYEAKQNQQTEERRMEVEEKNDPTPFRSDIPEVRPVQAEITRAIPDRNTRDDECLASLSNEWKGEIIDGMILKCQRQMTRKEYSNMLKQFKSEEEFLESPLLYILFRSEEQMEVNFTTWTDMVIKRINR